MKFQFSGENLIHDEGRSQTADNDVTPHPLTATSSRHPPPWPKNPANQTPGNSRYRNMYVFPSQLIRQQN